MARIKYSGLIDDIQGSIGGTTFQRNQYGYTVRRKPNMVIPKRKLQERQKPMMAAATRQWRTMSSANRSAWDTFASNNPQSIKHDPTVPMSGYAVFTRLNYYRQLAGLSLYSSAPDPTVHVGTIDISNVLASGDVFEVGLVKTGAIDEYDYFIFVTSPLHSGINQFRNRLRFIFHDFEPGGSATSPDDAYEDVYGRDLAENDRVGTYIVCVDRTNGYIVRSERLIFDVGVL